MLKYLSGQPPPQFPSFNVLKSLDCHGKHANMEPRNLNPEPRPQTLSSEPEVQKIPTAGFNPGYGCAILALMILTFAGIVTWVVHSLLEQDRQISGFTIESAPALPTFTVSDAGKTALRQKFLAFADAAAKGAAELTLEVNECNTALALATDAGIGGDKDSTPYPELLRITGFDTGARVLKTDIRLIMNKLPWRSGHRYLVGYATFRPGIENGSFVIRVETIEVPGRTVPEGFVRNMKIWDWLDVAKKKDSRISDALKRVSSWRIAADGSLLILEAGAATAPNPARRP